MKLMLTSCGIANNSIARALKKMAGKNIRIVFIPTAANTEDGEKDWLIKDYTNCQKLGPVDIVDIAAVEKRIWLPRLKKASVIVMGGGDTKYLMDSIISSGLHRELPALLKKRLYVGISAGSMVMSKNLFADSAYLYYGKKRGVPKCLGYVDFYIKPHLNSRDFPNARHEKLKNIILDGDMYALDDDSALVYDNGKISIVSEGMWRLYRKK